MRISFFTFGQGHRHEVNGVILDKDVVLRISAEEPRDVMFQFFGNKWAFEYSSVPNMKHFPRGVMDLNSLLLHGQHEANQTTEAVPKNGLP